MSSARENDLNPDVRIGLKLPFTRDRNGLFGTTENTLEQAGYNIKNLLLTAKSERVMQPDFGSRLRELLFEQYTEDLTERIREEIEKSKIKLKDKYLSVTISGGVSCMKEIVATKEHLVKSADTALYKSKNDGKNQISIGVKI